MSAEPDKDVELLSLFIKGAVALHPDLDPDGDALAALRSLESQNQALQEERDTYRDMWLTDHKAFEDERTISLVLQEEVERGERAYVKLFQETIDAHGRIVDENQALQERIEELEKVEKAARGVVGYLHRKFDDTMPGPLNIWIDELENALSPTQETDRTSS